MTFNNSHKALAITFLIIGTLVLSVLNVTVFKLNNAQQAETFYDIQPVEDFEEITPEQPQQNNNSKTTNKAFNKAENYKHFAQAYKPIAPPKDYKNPKLETYKSDVISKTSASKSSGNSSISEETLTSFESVNSVLSKRSQNQSEQQSNTANTNSSIYYSLKGRIDSYLPIPIYLCDAKGKIVVNITVNQNGNVVKVSINNASTSNNGCLEDYALKYAKEARFNSASKTSQIGTITFEFGGK